MKNVIVATAILIFAMTVMCLYAELNAEIREKRLLTDLAEEAAATAALFYDENAYGYGRYRFDRAKAEAMALESLRLNGFDKISDAEIELYDGGDDPYVKVTLEYDDREFSAVYEQKGF